MLGFVIALLIGGLAGIIAARLMKAEIPQVQSIVFGMVSVFVIDAVLGLFLITYTLNLVFGPVLGDMLWLLLIGTVGASGLIWSTRKLQNRT